MRKILFVTWAITLVCILMATLCLAAVPSLVSYQGKLTDSLGLAVPNGSYSLIFSLYDQETGGTQLWSEPQTVIVTGGLFTVLLGSVSPLPDSAFQGATWLETWVNREVLNPRIRIVSAGYAIKSKISETAETVADNSITSAKLASNEASLAKVSAGVMTSSTGKIGIGTANPQHSLSVNGVLNIDQDDLNDGGMIPALTFGSSGREGITSKRTTGGNQYGLDFYTMFTHRMAITSDGNVGIGATNPTVKLDVNGSAKIAGDLQVTGKLQTGSGAIAYAHIAQVGFEWTKLSGTSNVTAIWNPSIWGYEITIAGVTYDDSYVTIVSGDDPYQIGPRWSSTAASNGKLVVKWYQQSLVPGDPGNPVACPFSFVTLKP